MVAVYLPGGSRRASLKPRPMVPGPRHSNGSSRRFAPGLIEATSCDRASRTRATIFPAARAGPHCRALLGVRLAPPRSSSAGLCSAFAWLRPGPLQPGSARRSPGSAQVLFSRALLGVRLAPPRFSSAGLCSAFAWRRPGSLQPGSARRSPGSAQVLFSRALLGVRLAPPRSSSAGLCSAFAWLRPGPLQPGSARRSPGSAQVLFSRALLGVRLAPPRSSSAGLCSAFAWLRPGPLQPGSARRSPGSAQVLFSRALLGVRLAPPRSSSAGLCSAFAWLRPGPLQPGSARRSPGSAQVLFSRALLGVRLAPPRSSSAGLCSAFAWLRPGPLQPGSARRVGSCRSWPGFAGPGRCWVLESFYLYSSTHLLLLPRAGTDRGGCSLPGPCPGSWRAAAGVRCPVGLRSVAAARRFPWLCSGFLAPSRCCRCLGFCALCVRPPGPASDLASSRSFRRSLPALFLAPSRCVLAPSRCCRCLGFCALCVRPPARLLIWLRPGRFAGLCRRCSWLRPGVYWLRPGVVGVWGFARFAFVPLPGF